MAAQGSRPATSKVCCFCNLKEDNELEYGKIYEHDGIVTHYYCLLLSSNMEQKGNDDEGILGFLAEDIQKELRRGKRLVCSYCRKSGATLGCCNVKCKRIFHLPCGLKAGSLHQFFGEFRSYCVNHRPKQKIDDQILKQLRSMNNVLCYICYDKINTNDFVKTLWAPCCRKDAWFHRNCVQQLALSAGYFFKCPLCNNKKDFQKAMLEYGIFVPSQDASWELVPNAFEELLYRHDQCDAPTSLSKGKEAHNKWELTLCRTCGSQGIHMACGQLKWANPAWDCDECTSILTHEPTRLGNGSVINSSSLKRNPDSKSDPDFNPESNSESDLESESNSDSDTDISVGTDFPTPYSLASGSPSNISLDSILDVRLRPGPRSFKLQQQMVKLNECTLDLVNTDLKRNITEASEKDTNKSSSNNNDEKKEPSTSKENILQQESKTDNSQKEKQSSSKNDEKSQPIQKKADIITIESDDDDIELIALKQKTNLLPLLTQQPTQSHTPGISSSKQTTESSLNVIGSSAASKNQNVITIDLSINDNISIQSLSKPTLSKSEAASKNESIISNQVDVAIPQESMLYLVASNSNDGNSNDMKETIYANTNETPIMNIKITNVTSLPPEVFESVPNVCDNVTLLEDTTSLSTDKVLTELTHILSTKRSMHEANDVTNNCKKMKRNDFDKRYGPSSIVSSAVAVNGRSNTNNTTNINSTNMQQNKSTSASKSSEINKNDKDLSKCTSGNTNIFNPLNKQKNNSHEVHKANDVQYLNGRDQIVLHLEGNSISVNKARKQVQQSKKNSVVHRNTEYVDLAKSNQVLLPVNSTFCRLSPINGFYLQEIPNSTVSQSAVRTDKTNIYTVPSSSIILPYDDNITVLNNQTVLVNQPIVTNVTAPVQKNNQIAVVNQQEAVSKRNVPASIPSAGNNSSNKSYCDGDAGTRPAETNSVNRKKDGLSSDSYRSVVRRQGIASQTSAVTPRSVFPQVTNNQNTCHQPRLIPRYMNLQDLKFQVSESNNIQMTLYDMFSVNIPMKHPKESKSRSAGVAASRRSKETFILASRKASCSSDYIENIPTDRQRSDKFRSLKNENCSTNDKSTCEYVTHGRDDAKENLDPIRSRMFSRGDTSNNVNPTNNDAMTTNDRFYGENDSETRLISSDINLSVLNQTIYNTSVDNVTDRITLVSNNQGSRINLQQHKASTRSATPASAEERLGARLFYKESNRIVHSVDFDLNIVSMNKSVEKVSQDDITVPTSQHTDRIGNDHIDDSPTLWNGYKSSGSTNVTTLHVTRPKINRNVARVSNITKFNEHSILNKQIDTCDSRKFIRCIAFQENTVRHNGETGTKTNEFCLKVSIDLCKIQNLINSKPELFKNREPTNDKCMSRLSGLDDCTQQQVRYCECNDSIGNCSPKSRKFIEDKLY